MSILARHWRATGLGLLLVFSLVFPLVITDALIIQMSIDTLIFIGAVVAWNMFSGYTGYISLGHAVFFGAGAYAVGLLTLHLNLTGSIVFALFPLGGLAGAAFAVPFGLIALRVRRHTFVVITIAVFFIFQLLAYDLGFTRGNAGISAPFLQWNAATYNNPFYYAALVIALFTIVVSWLVRGSRFGLQLLAIRDDEDRARGLGVHTMRVKLTAFVMSAFLVGTIGGLWFYFIGQVFPPTGFDPNFDLAVALMGFLGGFGTLAGPVLGALILEPLQQYLTLQITNGFVSEIMLGAIFLLVILFLPRGLLPTISERLTTLRAWRERRGAPSAGAAPADGPAAPGGLPGAVERSGVSEAEGAR